MAQANPCNNVTEEVKDSLECAICLQTCVHPAELPCGHIFCFLCVKGIALQSRKCALCRQTIPRDYIDHPNLVKWDVVLEKLKAVDEQYQWFYEGRNGWWQYDERTTSEIETSYNIGQDKCEVLIAGFIYLIDFQSMVQYRKNEFSRRRRIKRDLATIPKKGVAGLRTDMNEVCSSDCGYIPLNNYDIIENQIPVTPANTPQSPNSERHTPEEDSFLDRFRSLQLESTHSADRNNNINDNSGSL